LLDSKWRRYQKNKKQNQSCQKKKIRLAKKNKKVDPNDHQVNEEEHTR